MEGVHADVVEPDFLVCPDILYADDTMLASSSAKKLQTLLDAVICEGKKYGLELNWAKTVAINIQNNGVVKTPSGTPVVQARQVVF